VSSDDFNNLKKRSYAVKRRTGRMGYTVQGERREERVFKERESGRERERSYTTHN